MNGPPEIPANDLDWRPWCLDARPAIEELLRTLDAPYSDVQFSSCYAWDLESEARWAELDGNLVLQMPDYASRETVTCLAGTDRPADAARFLLTNGLCTELSLVPRVTAETIAMAGGFIVEPDRNNDDYIYSLEARAELFGGEYKGARRRVSKFERVYPSAEVAVHMAAEVSDNSMQAELLGLFDLWVDLRQPLEDPEPERNALRRLLAASADIRLVLTTVRVDDALVGFSIDEILTDGWALGHFWKADFRLPCVYDFLDRATAQSLTAHGATLLNNEQDLGVVSMRTAKSQKHPATMLQKFCVRLP